MIAMYDPSFVEAAEADATLETVPPNPGIDLDDAITENALCIAMHAVRGVDQDAANEILLHFGSLAFFVRHLNGVNPATSALLEAVYQILSDEGTVPFPLGRYQPRRWRSR